jgi:hypothetical protein
LSSWSCPFTRVETGVELDDNRNVLLPMGTLVHSRTTRKHQLDADQVVGRAPDSGLQVDRHYVSQRQAAIRFREGAWCIKDLGSANGTFINNARIAHDWVRLDLGDVVAFGDQNEECWHVENTEPPKPALFSPDGGLVVDLESGLAKIPPNAPTVTVYRDKDGRYWTEFPDQRPTPLADRQTIEVDGQRWRFSEARSASTTAVLMQTHDVRQAVLHFSASADLENIDMQVQVVHEKFAMTTRKHNLLLLLLAVQLRSDREQGFPESACGWYQKEELERHLLTTRTELNTHLCRIRKQFGNAGFGNAFDVFQQRAKTRQIRLGVRDVVDMSEPRRSSGSEQQESVFDSLRRTLVKV